MTVPPTPLPNPTNPLTLARGWRVLPRGDDRDPARKSQVVAQEPRSGGSATSWVMLLLEDLLCALRTSNSVKYIV